MPEWHQCVGIGGMVLIVGSYLLLQVGRLSSARLPYSVLNAVGALLLIVSLLYEFNLAAMIVECFWAAISVVGIVRALRRPEDLAPDA